MKAKYVKSILVELDNGDEQTLAVFQHENGNLLGIDEVFLEESDVRFIPDPFSSDNEDARNLELELPEE